MFKKELDVAIQAAKAAGDIIGKYYGANYHVEHKAKDHPVTIADHEADAQIKKTIFDVFPHDGWLSEETKDTSDRLQKKRVWIVDPLDGTKEFIKTVPEFAVSIGLALESQVVVGVIYNPATKELFSASKGDGAFLNGNRIETSDCCKLKKATILASRSETKRGEWEEYQSLFRVQPTGGMAHKMAMVACGRADGSFSLKPKTEWDFCAGVLIVEEAGGRVSQLDGAPFVFNKENPRASGILFSCPLLFQSLFSLIVNMVY